MSLLCMYYVDDVSLEQYLNLHMYNTVSKSLVKMTIYLLHTMRNMHSAYYYITKFLYMKIQAINAAAVLSFETECQKECD